MALHFREIAEEPAGEIDQMHALVDQFAAAGEFRIGAPFPLVAGPAAVAVAAANEHQFAEGAAIEDLACFAEGAMIAVVEADADEGAGALGAARTQSSSAARRAPGFSISTCFPAAAAACDRGQHVVSGGYRHHVHVGTGDRGLPVGKGHGAVGCFGQSFGAIG